MTVAAFMDLALYDPEFGYYARASQRSGRAGDFFTNVDVGPLFGELLEIQLAEMFDLLQSAGEGRPSPVDLVEVGAGNGRLSADVLRAARRRNPALYERVALHLVEASPTARGAHRVTLGDVADRLLSSAPTLPKSFEGVLVANELLDAMPVHQVVQRHDGLREIYVDVARASPEAESPRSGPRASQARPAREVRDDVRLVAREGPPSTPALADYLSRVGIALEPGWRTEINLRAVDWVREAAGRMRRGFMILIDYGHEARELISATHANGTLTSFTGHVIADAESAADRPRWLERAGEQDLTAHVDFTSVRAAAEEAGLVTLGFLDQTYFLLGLHDGTAFTQLSQRLAFRTLMMPGGLGSTHKVLLLGKGVGKPPLRGCSFRQRVT